LRKSTGVQIDDDIIVFYSAPVAESTMLKLVLDNHLEKIKKMIKKPMNPESD